MAAPASAYKDRQFLAVIGDEVSLDSCNSDLELTFMQDSVTGLLLAGIGVGSSSPSLMDGKLIVV